MSTADKRVAAARAELRAALAEFDTRAGAVPVTRLANAIEDVIDARVAAVERLTALSQEPSP